MGIGITGRVVQVMCRSIQIISLDGRQMYPLILRHALIEDILFSGSVYHLPLAAILLEPLKIPEAVNVELPIHAQLPIFVLPLLLQNVRSVILDIKKTLPLRIHAPSVPQVNIKMNSLQVHFVKLVLLENIMMLLQVLLFVKIVRQGHGTMRQVELNYHTAKIVWQENTEQLQVCQHV